MNVLYLLGILLLLVLLCVPYVILVVANKQQGATRRIGQGLAAVFVVVLILSIVLGATGIAATPTFTLMGEHASPRMVRGMSGYLTGAMLEDNQAIDDFIAVLKANPQLLEKFKQRLQAGG
jgi:hypothetical protein